MSTWLYIASGIGAFIVFVLMFVLMTLADDWDSVNGTENNAPVTVSGLAKLPLQILQIKHKC